MEELDVMVRTTGAVPRPRPGADRRTGRRRPPVVAGAAGPRPSDVGPPEVRPSDVRWPAPQRGAVCRPGVPRTRYPAVPAPAGAPERVSRTRACLPPPRAARSGVAARGVRTRSERFLVGLATVLCSAVVVVVLGLLADATAGSSAGAPPGEGAAGDAPAPALPAPPGPWGIG